MMLCAAWAVVLAIGDRQDATIIAAVVVLNTVIGVVQEVRAQRAVDALTELASPRAHVRRDGVVVEVPAADVVPGDLVRLEAGDVVPADLGLVESSALQVDESAMTGESVPVDRDVGDEVLAGTVVSRGRGWGSVVRTGPDSGLGRVAALVASAAPRPTPLQRRLSILSRQLVVVTAVLCVVVMVLSVLRGASYVDASILAVSLGVAAIPESLPAVVTVALALGAHRMATPLRGGAVLAGRRDARLGDRVGLGQDRHADTGSAGGPATLDARRLLHGLRATVTTSTARSSGRRRRRPARCGCCATPRCATTPRWGCATRTPGVPWGIPSTSLCSWPRPSRA